MRLNQRISLADVKKHLKTVGLGEINLSGGISFSEKVVQKTGASSITNLGFATQQYKYVKSSAPNYVDPSGHKKQSWTETADQAKKNWQEYNKMPVQDYDSGPDYGSKNKELLEELDKKLSTARTKLQKLMDAAEEKGRSVIGYCSDYKEGMDAGRKIAEAEYHNWELTLLFGKNAYKRDDYFWDTDLQEIYDQARNASNNKDAFSAGFTAGQTMFTIEILSLIVGALESGGSSSGGKQVVLPGVGEVTIPGDAAGSVAGALPPGSILRDQENKKESEEEGKGESNSKVSQESDMRKQTNEQLQKSKESYEKLIKEHQQKLDDYIKDLYAHDNKGIIENAPNQGVRDKIIQGRIDALQKQINKQLGELEKITDLLRERGISN